MRYYKFQQDKEKLTFSSEGYLLTYCVSNWSWWYLITNIHKYPSKFCVSQHWHIGFVELAEQTKP